MAFREVELTKEEQQTGGSFFKFAAIGDRLSGLFLGSAEVEGKYGKQTNYRFKTKTPEGAIVETILSAPTDADRKLKKAQLKPGYRVIIEYTSDLDVGKQQPMRIFKVLVDDSPAVKPPPPPPVPVAGVDDTPF